MSFLEKVRQHNPLVHNITNVVVTNFTANGLLALGASPFMAYAHEEVAEVAAMAGAIMLNIGTLDPYTVQSIKLAGRAANAAGVPVVFDPVGAGATAYRTASAHEIIADVRVDILRGNIAEVAHVIGESWQIKGVDAGGGEGDRAALALRAAQKLDCIVVITGQQDIITDGVRLNTVSNGHALLTQVTGAGCLLSSVVAAFAAVAESNEQRLEAVTEAVASYGLAAELAAIDVAGQGTGSFQVAFLNRLSTITAEHVADRSRVQRQIDPAYPTKSHHPSNLS